jgi:hypothetical protein
MDRYDHIWGVFITGGGKRCRMDLMFIPPEYWTYALVGEWVCLGVGVMGWVGEWVGGWVGGWGRVYNGVFMDWYPGQ